MRRNHRHLVPAVIENEILADRMERALTKPDSNQREVERYRKHMKAGTYTLAEKYALALDGFRRR